MITTIKTIKYAKLNLKKSERPNYWHVEERSLSVVYRAATGKILKRDCKASSYADLQNLYRLKIMHIWREIFFKINESLNHDKKYDFKLSNFINSNFVDLRFPIKLCESFYYMKIGDKFYRVHKDTFRKVEITQAYYSLGTDKLIILDLKNYDIKDPGSPIVFM